jgi:hypothetical protein
MDKMVDLARAPAEVKKANTVNYKPSPYGYGTSISLDHDQLKKLGITELPEVGDEYSITASGKVTSASKNSSEESGSRTSLSIQITHLKLTHEDEAEEKKETPAEEKAEQIKPAAKPAAKKSASMFGGGIGGIKFR